MESARGFNYPLGFQQSESIGLPDLAHEALAFHRRTRVIRCEDCSRIFVLYLLYSTLHSRSQPRKRFPIVDIGSLTSDPPRDQAPSPKLQASFSRNLTP